MDISIKALFDCRVPYLTKLFSDCVFPWEMLPKIKQYVTDLIKTGIDGYTVFSEGVLVGKNVKISRLATIEPPVVIGDGCELRPGAYLRGNVILGRNCVIGNSTELKNCILLDNVEVPHYNYVGDSVLGNYSHLGAGAVCSNLKADNKSVVIHSDTDYETGLRKVGAVLADKANIGCNCVMNPGTVVGKNTSVYPLTSLRGVYPCDSIVKSSVIIVKREENL